MNPEVFDLAANSCTVVRTDGWKASAKLGQSVRHEVVVHKKEWVTVEGVHTNTVESRNSFIEPS